MTLQYDEVLFILEPSNQARAAIGKWVTVVDYPDGRLSIGYRGVELAYRTFDKLRQAVTAFHGAARISASQQLQSQARCRSTELGPVHQCPTEIFRSSGALRQPLRGLHPPVRRHICCKPREARPFRTNPA